jgi:hypothetical protein
MTAAAMDGAAGPGDSNLPGIKAIMSRDSTQRMALKHEQVSSRVGVTLWGCSREGQKYVARRYFDAFDPHIGALRGICPPMKQHAASLRCWRVLERRRVSCLIEH